MIERMVFPSLVTEYYTVKTQGFGQYEY